MLQIYNVIEKYFRFEAKLLGALKKTHVTLLYNYIMASELNCIIPGCV